MKRKRVPEQVIVITGATSGIGLATAREAVARGARVVLTARNEEDLAQIATELGERAAWVGADVSDLRAVELVRDTAVARFGGFDTWINNAGLSLYGDLAGLDVIEARRLFDVNFWGVVHGTSVALAYLREREGGGAIVNVGSALAPKDVPFEGMFTASKAAVQAYTESMRAECERDGIPVSVSLVRPANVDTPFMEHARNHLGSQPPVRGPVYSPNLVAEVLLHCAEHGRRDVKVGRTGRKAPLVTEQPLRDEDALFLPPLVEGKTRGVYDGKVLGKSLSTLLSLHPLAAFGLAVGAALFTTGLTIARR
jgi:short-subunit dehydrogenase